MRNAIGAPVRIPAPLAALGVREVLNDLYPRQVRLGRMAPLRCSLEIGLLDDHGGREETLLLGPAQARGDSAAAIELPAMEALLLLWKRRTIDDVATRRSGSERALQNVLSSALVP
ncbi:hypothetical protein GCM10025867_30010 [Frondihabitans sucicola]|uniref:MDMPI C-terminal domain-containing protein n=1 Tax=Frondihabitans sucicola TaxID=1268041 RepID=A0ABM8GQM4_9MICO|nr:hypothetical protein GCM10025867_30010 [Frondihabitans sucicola]